MKCNCIEEIKQKILEGPTLLNGRIVEQVEIEVAFRFHKSGEISASTYTSLRCTLKGLKKPVATKLIHTFCPFCGTRIEEDES